MEHLQNEETKYFELYINILDLARRAREIYEKRSPEERRLLLGHLFSNLFLKDKKADYLLRKPAKLLAKRVQERIDAQKEFERQKSLVKQGQMSTHAPQTNSLLRD